jgi:hypothetical protein
MRFEPRTPFEELKKQVVASVAFGTPALVISAIITQVHTAEEARERIDREGSVVRDMGGKVIAHPALKIESDAIKLYTSLLDKYRRKTPKIKR